MRGRVRRSSDTCPFREQEVQKSSFFLTTHYRQMARGSVLTWTGCAFQILLTCFASSLFFHTLVSPILVLVVLSGVFQLGEGWAATQRCSFGENTDGGHHFSSLHLKMNERMQIHQKGICMVFWGETFCLNSQSFENQDFGKYVFICIVCHGRAGDSISRVPCTCSYKLIKIPCPLNFLRLPCFFIICGTW